jgi:hypothetical protein
MNWQIKIRIGANRFYYFSPGKRTLSKPHKDIPFLELPNTKEENKVKFYFEKERIYFSGTEKFISGEFFGILLENNLVKVDGQCQVFKTECFIPPKIKLRDCRQCGKETVNYFRCPVCIRAGVQFTGEIMGYGFYDFA